MYRLLAILVLFFCTLNAAAFSLKSTDHRALSAKRTAGAHQARQFSNLLEKTSTSLNLRVKVDPNEKEERLNPAVFKNALYLGSVLFAVLLPVILLFAGSK